MRAWDRTPKLAGGRKCESSPSIIEQVEDGWLVGSVPSLRGCHTQASNMEELLENIKEAILLCLEAEPEPHRC